MNLFPLNLTKTTDELKRLIAENPELPIVVLAGEEANSRDYRTMYCTDVRFSIGEVLEYGVPYMSEIVETDRVNFEENIGEWLWDIMGGNDKNTELSETEFESALEELKAKYEPYWKKVIEIYVNN